MFEQTKKKAFSFDEDFDQAFSELLNVTYNKHDENIVDTDENIVDTKNGKEIQISVPGFNKDEISVNVEGDYLYVSGIDNHKKISFYDSVDDKKENKIKKSFSKKFKLNHWFDIETLRATVRNGILYIFIGYLDRQNSNSKQIDIE